MIDQLDQALLRLQAAYFSRGLYSREHLAVQEHEGAAHAQLTEVLGHGARIAVACVGGRVVSGNAVLPSSESFQQGLFARLRAAGAESISFEHGVTIEELRELLDQLESLAAIELASSKGNTASHAGVIGTAHIRLGSIIAGHQKPKDQNTRAMRIALGDHTQSLEQLWGTIAGDEAFDTQALAGMVQDICTAVIGGGDLIPRLAALKRYDEYTFVHTINVGILSASLAEAIGLKPDLVHDTAIAALLHDVGKSAVPETILNKKGSLSDDEFKVMQTHPVHGARMLLNTGQVPDAAIMVAFEHHIHIDGTGYPKPRRGWKPHLTSQVVQIADVFDALRTNRPYRAALSLDESLGILNKGRGVRFDADLLDVFCTRIARKVKREGEYDPNVPPERILVTPAPAAAAPADSSASAAPTAQVSSSPAQERTAA